MENNVLQIFEECTNGRAKCVDCPYHNKKPYCTGALGEDIITYIETLKNQIEYYQEVVEEYEKAELDRESIYKPIIELTDMSATFYGKDTWTMTLDATSSDSVYTTATASSCCCDEGLTSTASKSYKPTEGLTSTALESYKSSEDLTTSIALESYKPPDKYALDSSYKSLEERVFADLEAKPTIKKPVGKWLLDE